MICHKSDANAIALVSHALKTGKIVILPTDTVYGFSGVVDTAENGFTFATDDVIRHIKGRSETKPLIQLIARPSDVFLYTHDIIPNYLLQKWPGALTIIIHVKQERGGGTIAFRCPGDEWLRTVIQECGSPIYSTSVNRSGCPVLHNEAEIRNEFESEVDLIVCDGDTAPNAKPSTLIAIQETGNVTVLRQGTVVV
ncbi:MAG: L-threonylcarbamoyladenylate synthase [Treponema sp.]|nr:L-threonylcarbamoyladenylate synthase [Treponema sp.]